MKSFLIVVLFGSLALAIGCGGGSGTSTVTKTVTPPAAQNSQAISIDGGPAAFVSGGSSYPNGIFTTAIVCVPGTTTCNTIDHLLVDTGSVGLRILHSSAQGELTISLPMTSVNGVPIGECTQFADNSFLWGPVATADVKIAGEVAKSVPVNIVGDTASANFTTVPNTCDTGGVDDDSLANMGAYGILGVGIVQHDCGSACVTGTPPDAAYYSCPSASTCAASLLPLAEQVQNPVSLFATDNNGVILELPAAASPQASLSGSLVFGIGTQSDNALGNATVLTIDQSFGFTTKFNGTTLTGSFIDSGSNGFFFDDNNLPNCQNSLGFYCPSTPANLSAVNTGANGVTSSVTFTVSNADGAFSSFSNDEVFPGLAGPNGGTFSSFDFGLPFFYGRNVYTSIATQTAAPYWAY